MPRLIVATGNEGKMREFERLFRGVPFTLMNLRTAGVTASVDETGATYAENAILKARAAAKATGSIALGDDSGLEVDALDGQPGLHSARFGGPGLDDAGRTALLLRELDGIPAAAARTARFRAVLALAWPDGTTETFAGVVEGTIADAPRGERGFGYDPIFLLPDGRTMAELDDDEKDRISHRAIAARAAARRLAEIRP